MGYFDNYLKHEDGRDKGMNSTSSEKGTDGKKNNTSEYNHQYYMKNKDKWQDNKSSVGTKMQYYKEGDSDFDSEDNYNEKNRLGNTDFFGWQKPDGSFVITEEDTKWTLPSGVNRGDLIKILEEFDKKSFNSAKEWEKAATEVINGFLKKPASGEKEFDVDAAARDVIRGKYGNGAERKAALGDDYAEVQKRVNEILGGKTSSEPKKTSNTNKNTSKPVDGPKETPHANFPSSNSTSSAPRARKKNVTGNGTGLYRRGKVDNSGEDKAKKKNTTYMKHYFVDKSESLEHHGILGQKWGVRRFEKAGGGLTAAGKARYQTDSNGNYKKVTVKTTSDAYARYKKSIKSADKAESKYNANSDNAKALSDWNRYLKDADAAKKEFTRSDKKQYKADKKAEKAANHKGLSDKQKKALKIGAAVTATALASYGVYKVSQINKKPKAFTTEQLKSMGLNVIEPKRIEVNKVQLNRTPVNITSSKPIKTVNPSASSVSKANESLQATLNMMKNISSSTPASSGQNDFVYDLLKKNSATLSSLGF